MFSSPVSDNLDQLYGIIGGVGGSLGSLFGFVLGVMMVVASWKLFKKAGQPGWASLIPIYGDFCRARMVFGSGWYFLILLIPGVNVIFTLVELWKTATVFGGGILGKLGMLFFSPFVVMYYAFGSAVYQGPYKK